MTPQELREQFEKDGIPALYFDDYGLERFAHNYSAWLESLVCEKQKEVERLRDSMKKHSGLVDKQQREIVTLINSERSLRSEFARMTDIKNRAEESYCKKADELTQAKADCDQYRKGQDELAKQLSDSQKEVAKVREELRETKKVADLLQQSANRGLMGYHDVNNTAVDLNDGIDTSVKI
jgi:chromosome segregation ATPase